MRMEFFKIPDFLKREHEALHDELMTAAKEEGKTGQAARAVARLMHPHFTKEEDFALPPLGLLPYLVEGEVSPVMRGVIAMTDRLKVEWHEMLGEHDTIVAALNELKEAARQEDKMRYVRFADRLMAHERSEEELLYPAAILVGEYLKLKLGE
jgi:hypothetical protein